MKIGIYHPDPILAWGIQEVLRTEAGLAPSWRKSLTEEFGLPELSGLEVFITAIEPPVKRLLSAAKKQLSCCPRVVAVFDAPVSLRTMNRLKDYGIRGFVSKNVPPLVLVECIDQVGKGRCYIEAKAIDAAIEEILKGGCGQKLTKLEYNVLRLAVRGCSDEAIARIVQTDLGTILVHKRRLGFDTGVQENGQTALLMTASARA